MKIILVTPLLQPYRISFYEKLSFSFPDLTVYYDIKRKEDGRPNYNREVTFKTKGFEQKGFKFLKYQILWSKGLFYEIKKELPNVIIIQGIPGNISYQAVVSWAKRKRIYVIFWYCGWEPNSKRNNFLKMIKKRIAINYYLKGNYFLAYSSKAAQELVSIGIPSESISVAFNGIEIDNYQDISIYGNEVLEIRNKYCEPDTIVYLYVGGLLEEKRILLLIDSFKIFSKNNDKVQLWIIGDGPQRSIVEARIKNQPNIKYFGRIIEGVESYFIASDYYILPGTGGLGLNQAMFFESVCICSKADGTEDDLIIDNETGLRFIEDDYYSLYKALTKSQLLDCKTKMGMKTKAKNIIVTYSNTNYMVDKFVIALNNIIQTKQHK